MDEKEYKAYLPLPGKPPYYGSLTVTIEYYNDGRFIRVETLSCPGSYGYRRAADPTEKKR